jgi:hypothetical protein
MNANSHIGNNRLEEKLANMKNMSLLLGTLLISLIVGCSSTPPVTMRPMGPSPAGTKRTASGGGLAVYSSLQKESDDQSQGSMDPFWYQHSDYNIYTVDGQSVEYVSNELGHYSQTPPVVILPPGKYIVEARAVGYLPVRVPVTIKRGRITFLHLDGVWVPPPGTAQSKLVTLPDGKAAGWSATPNK